MTPEQAQQLEAINARVAALTAGTTTVATTWSNVTPKGTEPNSVARQLAALAERPAATVTLTDADRNAIADAIAASLAPSITALTTRVAHLESRLAGAAKAGSDVLNAAG